ncbi:MAG: LCP family protein, partial [Anaerolineaceae bacterium]|nr:LCP family protein [Anaerolineaceae bacterium]
INTVHFFAEAERPGSGPAALIRLIREQFKVPMRYYVRIRFDGFVGVVDAMGGVVIVLQKPMGSYPAGRHHLQGEQALAFVRDRRGTDDFFRMQQAQVFIQAAVLQTISPANWVRLPTVVRTAFESLDTNIPLWQFPRLGLALVRASLTGIDSYTLDRTMVIPYTTTGGAQVLLPQWERIRPLVAEIFGP